MQWEHLRVSNINYEMGLKVSWIKPCRQLSNTILDEKQYCVNDLYD